jgi:hypothetical protein
MPVRNPERADVIRRGTPDRTNTGITTNTTVHEHTVRTKQIYHKQITIKIKLLKLLSPEVTLCTAPDTHNSLKHMLPQQCKTFNDVFY